MFSTTTFDLELAIKNVVKYKKYLFCPEYYHTALKSCDCEINSLRLEMGDYLETFHGHALLKSFLKPLSPPLSPYYNNINTLLPDCMLLNQCTFTG